MVEGLGFKGFGVEGFEGFECLGFRVFTVRGFPKMRGSLLRGYIGGIEGRLHRGFPEQGVPFWGPYNTDFSISGSVLDSAHILGNSHVAVRLNGTCFPFMYGLFICLPHYLGYILPRTCLCNDHLLLMMDPKSLGWGVWEVRRQQLHASSHVAHHLLEESDWCLDRRAKVPGWG